METQISNVKGQNHISNPKTDTKLRAYSFSLQIIRLIDIFPTTKAARIIADQLLRAGTSVGANIVEAKSSSSKREFIKYHEIALKSVNETKYWLCLLRDAKILQCESISPILEEAVALSNMIASGLLTMKGKK